MVRVLLVFAVVLQSAVLSASVDRFPIAKSDIAISAQPRFEQPFDVAGPRSLIVGLQNGVFESWIYPVKLLSDLRVEAEMADYPARLDLNKLAANIEVNPAYTVITYSHIAFTVRQIMFAPREGRAAVVLFAIDGIRPMKLRVSFVPEMRMMWPATSAAAYPGWDEKAGVALFNTDQAGLQGVVGIAGAKYEILRPYQERAEAARFVLTFDYDPKADANKFFPLIMTVGEKEGEAVATYQQAASSVPQLFAATQQYFDRYFDRRTVVETPDATLNRELKWAMLAIEKSRVRFKDEEGLIAGYHMSGNTARPGFGWFFGRDTLWTLFAVNSYGDQALTRTALDFLLARQRKDGKIMHEFSQAADRVDWEKLPYFYASADSTPLMIVVMDDYLRHSGDVEYVRRNWDKVKLAYTYCQAHDTDKDGFYDNAGSGHGWIESGPLSEPFQEAYLAGVYTDSLQAISEMAKAMGDSQLARTATKQYETQKRAINKEYWDAAGKRFAFSRRQDGTLDTSATILPSVAMWNRLLDADKAAPMLDEWASHVFSTDWGTRILANDDKNYDPISYHNGSVWPLFTGWVSLAEYRYGRPLAGYQHLRQNSMLTFAQDPGYVTELLSGDFFTPFPRSSPHQMWSSAMVLTPFLRGTLGMDVDAAGKVVRFAPQFPAGWDVVHLRNVAVGSELVDVDLRRGARGYTAEVVKGNAKASVGKEDPAMAGAPQIALPEPSPTPGERTTALKFLDYRPAASGTYQLSLEGLGGESYTFAVCASGALSATGAMVTKKSGCWNDVTVRFEGIGYRRGEVSLRTK
jgi:glycogen debranching enzyme